MAKRKQENKDNWISGAIKHEGALREKLRVPEGKPIPASKLKIKPGDSAQTKRQKTLAQTLRKINRKRKKSEK